MATRSLGSLTVDLDAKTGKFEQGMSKAERAAKKLQDQTKRQQSEFDRLVKSIDPVMGKFNDLDKQQQQLDRLYKKGGTMDASVYTDLSKKIDAQRESLSRITDGNKKAAISAGQLANANRMLPAQFSDIAISLQGGQNPLTVFLQQGAQIKDMYGGAGLAIREFTKYVISLINPLTVGAAVAGSFAIAAYKGSQESNAFAQSLALTGNTAGVTVDQMMLLSAQLDDYGTTRRKAAAALNEVVKSGKFTADQLKLVTQTAIEMERATGQSIEETVKTFTQIADDPVAAVVKLNDQYNFLTADIYQQIQALEAQGRTVDAQKLAMESYSDVMRERARQVSQNLGWIQSAWGGIKTAAGEAWDAMLGIGREASIDQQISQLRKQLSGNSTDAGILGVDINTNRKNRELEAQIAIFEGIKFANESAAKATAERQRNESRSIAALSTLNDKYTAGLDRQAQKQREIKALNDTVAAAMAGENVDVDAVQRQYDVALAGINKKYEDQEQRVKRTAAYQDNAATKLIMQLRQQEQSLTEQLDTSEKVTSSRSALLRFEQQITDLKSKDQLTASQKSLLANETAIRQQYNINVAIEEQIKRQKELISLESSKERLVNSLLSKNEKALSLTKSQIEEIQKLSNAGLISNDQADKLNTKAFNSGFEDAPSRNYGNTQSDEFARIESDREKLETWHEQQLEMLEELNESKLASVEDYLTRKNEIEAMYQEQAQSINRASLDAQLGMYSNTFSAMAGVLQGFGDEQSLLYKSMFVASKSFAVAQALINAPATASEAYKALAGIPVIGPALGIAAATAAVSAQLANAQQIKGVSIAGQAHDGIMSVPNSGTWNLEKGERVTTANTSKRLDKTLSDIQRGQQQGSSSGSAQVNMTVINNTSAQVRQRTDSKGQLVLEISDDLANDGPISQAFAAHTNLQRRVK